MSQARADNICDLDAERSVLGAAFLSGAWAYDRAALEPGEFYHIAHREVWAAIGRLVTAKKPVDPVTAGDEIPQDRLAAMGGLSVISDFVSAVPTADNVEHYAAIVRRDALTRRVILELAGVLAAGTNRTLEGEELLGRAFEVVSNVGTRITDGAVTMPQALRRRFKQLGELADAQARGDKVTIGIPTGLTELDGALGGGIPEGVTTILGGRPSHGKSAAARTFADSATEQGFGVHVFSLEDTADAYVDRSLADHARIDLQSLKSADLTRENMASLYAAADRLNRREQWLIDDRPGLSSAEIAMSVRRHRRDNKTRLVVVDYVQRMRERGKWRTRDEEIGHAATALDDMARREGVALVLLSQLNRGNAREKRRPEMHDLRESGNLEQVAKNVLFVYQHDEDDDGNPIDPPRGEIIVAKQKDGRRSVCVPLHWDAKTATYRNLVRGGAGRMPQQDTDTDRRYP